MKKLDISGMRFNSLVALKDTKKDKKGQYYWLFKCDCGNEKEIIGYMVRTGKQKSCGCLNSINWHATRGLKPRIPVLESKLYSVWKGIKSRCDSKKDDGYQYYGGRGIKCLWKSFSDFEEDMLDSFDFHVKKYGRKETTIDRIDVNGNYCKKNCRWATRKEQGNNRRNNIVVEYKGETHSVKEWAKIKGIKPITLYCRLSKGKMTKEEALNKKVKRKK